MLPENKKRKHIYRIRLSDDELELIHLLQKYEVPAPKFIREAFHSKIQSELPEIKEEFRNRNKFKAPF